MENRIGMGHHWRFDKLASPYIGLGSGDLSYRGIHERQKGKEEIR